MTMDIRAAAREALRADYDRRVTEQRNAVASFEARVRDGLGVDLYTSLKERHDLAASESHGDPYVEWSIDGARWAIRWRMGEVCVWSPSGFHRTCAFGDLRREVLLSIGRWQARAGADDIAVQDIAVQDIAEQDIAEQDIAEQDIAEQDTVSLDGADLARWEGNKAGWWRI
jgi:hypothetical protein